MFFSVVKAFSHGGSKKLYFKNIRKAGGVITLPLREGRLSQLVGDTGGESLDNQRSRAKEKVTWNLFFSDFDYSIAIVGYDDNCKFIFFEHL